MYKSFQCELLDNELKSRQREERRIKTEVESTKNELREVVSWIDFLCLCNYVCREVGKLRTKTSAIQSRKLENLGARATLASVDPSRVVMNLSDRVLSDREEFLLSFGLQFSFPVHKLSFYKYFLSIERFLKILGRCTIREGLILI